MLVAFGDDLEQQLSTSLVRGKVSQLVNNQEPSALVSGIQRSSPFIQSTSVFRSSAYRLITPKVMWLGRTLPATPRLFQSIRDIRVVFLSPLRKPSHRKFPCKERLHLLLPRRAQDAFVSGTGEGTSLFSYELPRIIRLKENAPELDYSSFYGKTGTGKTNCFVMEVERSF